MLKTLAWVIGGFGLVAIGTLSLGGVGAQVIALPLFLWVAGAVAVMYGTGQC